MPYTGPFEDRLAIRELLEVYADAVNRNDAEAWARPSPTMLSGPCPDYPEIGTTSGKTAIVAMWVEAMKQYPGIMFEAWPGSIEVQGDTAAMRSYTAEVYDQGEMTVRDRGVYEDTCVKRAGRWLFKSRSFHKLHRQQGPRGC